MKDLRVVFMGTPEFSLDVLQGIIDNTNVIAVVTQPDKEVGRGNKLSFSPVKDLALKYNIPVIQPVKIRKEYQSVIDLHPDMIVTCAYGQIIPKVILDEPKYGCINVHASLLPKLRGGAPLHHAIIDGYDKTGVTIMYMDVGMDTGDIISQQEIDISDSDTVGSIHDKLKVIGRDLLLQTIPKILNGTNNRIKQNEEEVTICHNISHEEELIDFNDNARNIFNKVRGMNPFPVAYFKLDGKVYKIYQVHYELKKIDNKENGEIIVLDKKELGIKCSNGIIYIDELKKEGKKKMAIIDFLNGEKELKVRMIVDKEK
ncbi:MAG: methionyl-tRNA formyltransferase [Bacilli bacterium]|nr:methionyl-tRNA formyltransferase [Bacilli bacterium]